MTTNSEVINKILFDYNLVNALELRELIKQLPLKTLRWLGANHQDNKTRKLIFRLSNISIGSQTVINANFIVSDDYKNLLKIGERVAISPNVTIICCSAPNNSNLQFNAYVKDKLIAEKEVVIGNDVWIGANTVILPGVKIGSSSIIGANSLVTGNVKENSIYAGSPAKLIREF